MDWSPNLVLIKLNIDGGEKSCKSSWKRTSYLRSLSCLTGIKDLIEAEIMPASEALKIVDDFKSNW